MPIVVFDVENTTYVRPDKTIDMSPFCPGNKLVSVGWGFVEGDRYVPGDYVFFHHQDMTPEQRSMVPENRRRFQDVLDRATLLVGHNVKHDLKWIIESGFTYDGPIYCTMVGEYLLLRGQKGRSLKLEALAEHYDVFRKKADLTRQYLADGVQFDAIPMHIIEEYGRADVHSCAEVFIAQRAEYETPRSRGMRGIRDTAMEYTRVLTDMERAGIPIDLAELARVEQAYRDEKAQLERRLREIVQEVMGDRPCNLASPEQLSWVIYSRRLTDKKQWAKTFNCGTDWRGKRLRPPNMTTQEFVTKARGLTTPLRKQKALHCVECSGVGHFYKRTKKGELWKKPTKCKACNGAGVVYADLNAWAGFRLSPRGVVDVRSDGFATDAQALVRLRYQAEKRGDKLAVEFLTAVQRLNAVESYLSSFVGGIKRSVLANGILHPNLNQTITSTQRLSSTEPNFQNLPRGNKAPIRRVVVSRWRDQGGEIMEADYSSLEFVTAGELADDPVIFQMKRDKIDPHKKTATIIYQIPYEEVNKDQRQDSKPHTFAPLYGATGSQYPEHIRRYYVEFPVTYPGVGRWHKQLQDEAIRNKMIVLPDGKQFAFPHAQRQANGGSTFATQIKNWPVQYFATGSIVPLGIIRLWHLFRKHNLKSLIILTVHDSVVVDRHPDEPRELIAQLMAEALPGARDELRIRYGYNMRMPLDIEISAGRNWLDKEEVHVT